MDVFISRSSLLEQSTQSWAGSGQINDFRRLKSELRWRQRWCGGAVPDVDGFPSQSCHPWAKANPAMPVLSGLTGERKL